MPRRHREFLVESANFADFSSWVRRKAQFSGVAAPRLSERW